MSRRDLFALILMACLLVAGIGAAASYLMHPFQATGSGGAMSPSLSRSGADGEMLARLKDYTRSIGAEEPASTPATGTLQPDVSSMIEKLAARLEATPADIKGWRMLGWSYFHTGRYEQAAAAYARALQLDPDSAELKRSHEGAKAKALDSAIAEDASSFQSDGRWQGWWRSWSREHYQLRSHDVARALRRHPIDGRRPGGAPEEFSARH